MSTIFLDPVQMDATAGTVGQHAREAEAAVANLESSCSAEVPADLAGWLAQELREIAVQTRLTALLYTVAALDTALRAQQIQTDQSLATAVLAPGSTSVAFTETVMGGFGSYGSSVASVSELTGGGGSPLVGGFGSYGSSVGSVSELTGGGASQLGGFVLAPSSPGFGAVEMRMQSAEEFRVNNPLLAAAERMQHTNPGGAAQLMGVHAGIQASQNLGIGRDNQSRPGVTFIGNGLFQGLDGRIGSQIYRPPDRPGEFRVG